MRYVVLCLFLFGIALFCHHKTDRFALTKIQSSLAPNPQWETEPLQNTSPLQQPYYYLDHGAQSYVFTSADDQYVLKFYRHSRTSHPLAWLKGALPLFWKQKLEQTLLKRRGKQVKDFNSFKLAFDHLQDESALLWVHLNTYAHEHIPITLYDKIRIKHDIDLGQFTFLLQRRANPFYPTMQRWIEEEKWDEAKEALTSLVELLKHRCSQGLFDKDPDLETNFGFLKTKAIQIDVGRFKEDASRKNGKVAQADLIRITDKLEQWLQRKAPELAKHLHEEVYL